MKNRKSKQSPNVWEFKGHNSKVPGGILADYQNWPPFCANDMVNIGSKLFD